MPHKYLSDDALKAFGMKHEAAETKQRNANDAKHKKVVKDAKLREPRTRAIALSDVLVTRADGTQYVQRIGAFPMHRKTTKTNGNNAMSHTRELHERMMKMPSLHNPNGSK